MYNNFIIPTNIQVLCSIHALLKVFTFHVIHTVAMENNMEVPQKS